MLMSLSGFSDSRWINWAQIRLAIVSSIGRAQEDDVFLEEARIQIESPFPSVGLLDHRWDVVVHDLQVGSTGDGQLGKADAGVFGGHSCSSFGSAAAPIES